MTVELTADDQRPWHPGRCARLTVDGRTVGYAGELHPAVLERAHLPKRTCAVEIDIDALPLDARLPAPSVSVFPAVLQDVNVVVGGEVPAADVQKALREGAGDLLEDIALFGQRGQAGRRRRSRRAGGGPSPLTPSACHPAVN